MRALLLALFEDIKNFITSSEDDINTVTHSYCRHVHMFYGDLISNLFLRQYHSSASTGICHAPETAEYSCEQDRD